MVAAARSIVAVAPPALAISVCQGGRGVWIVSKIVGISLAGPVMPGTTPARAPVLRVGPVPHRQLRVGIGVVVLQLSYTCVPNRLRKPTAVFSSV